MSLKLFESSETRSAFPSPIARALEILMAEIEESGLETTADETATVIEAVFSHLGRLWVAEYLELAGNDAQAVSGELNELVFERFSQGRPVLLGQWIVLSRTIRNHFQASGAATIMQDLVGVDYGGPGDATHPVSRLVHFRNHFSHGSFLATRHEITGHQQLIHDLLDQLPCLRHQPAVVHETETGVHLAATGTWPEVEPPPGEPFPAAHPVITGGESRQLDLYPMLQLARKNGSWTLAPSSDREAFGSLFHRPGLDVWLEKYEHERRGHLRFELSGEPRALPSGVKEQLREALAAPAPGLILVEAHPGGGSAQVVSCLDPGDNPEGLELGRFASTGRVAVRPGQPGQSGFMVAQMVLRLIEQALGLEDGHYQADLKNILLDDGPLSGALRDLRAGKREVLLGLDGLHHGVVAYRGEPLTVLGVYQFLAGSPVGVVATVVPGGVARPFYDRKIQFPLPAEPAQAEIGDWVRALCGGHELRRRVLGVLGSREEQWDLFSVCNALDKAGHGGDESVFEPAVERALWDLRPLLSWSREMRTIEDVTERVRLWKLFSPAVREAYVDIFPEDPTH